MFWAREILEATVGQDGRDAQFAAFVVAVRPQLTRIAHLMCGDWHQAEDVVQVVLVRLYPRWEKVCRAGDPTAYVRRSLVNALIDERRRPWRREELFPDIADAEVHSLHFGEPSTASSSVLGVFDALDQIPPRRRAVVILRYVEDLSVREVANLLGISEGTVKSQCLRGLESLRKLLDASSTTVPKS